MSKLFILCLATALYEGLIARELAVAFFGLWLVLLAVVAVAHAAFGAGAALAAWRAASQRRVEAVLPRDIARSPSGLRFWTAWAGAAVLLSLAVLLALRPGTEAVAAVAVAIAAVLTASVLFGAAYAAAFTDAVTEPYDSGLGLAAAVSFIGFAAGLLLSVPAATGLGVNAALAALGLALLLCGLGLPRPVWAAVLLAPALWRGADGALERLRPASLDCNFRCSAEWIKSEFKPLFGGWTPFSRLDVFINDSRTAIYGAYNYRVHWMWVEPRRHQPIWTCFVRAADRVLIIGASAGFDAALLPLSVDPRNVDLVEIDPVVVGLFKRDPTLNGGLFTRARVHVMDGRAYLDEYRGRPYEAVIVGSLDSPSRSFSSFNTMKAHLLTREGVRAALGVLAPDGVVVFTPRDLPSADNVMRVLQAEGVPWRLIGRWSWPFVPRRLADGRIGRADERVWMYTIYAAKNPRRLAQATGLMYLYASALRRDLIEPDDLEGTPESILRKIKTGMRRRSPTEHNGPATVIDAQRWARAWIDGKDFTTDDRPFGLASLSQQWRPAAVAVAFCLLALAFLCGAGLELRGGGRGAYFLAIGMAFIMMQTALVAKWQSCFGDPMRTAMVVLLTFGLGAAAGSFWSGPLPDGVWKRHFLAISLGRRRQLFSAAWAVWAALAIVGARAVPLSNPHLAVKSALLLLLVLPVGFGCGLFFPRGFKDLSRRYWTGALLWDGLGAGFGLVLFFAVSSAWGISWNLPAAVGLYGVALLLRGGRTVI